MGVTDADKLSTTLASYNLGPTNINNLAFSINENVENVSWVEIKESLKTLKNSEINLMDNDPYTRCQQAIDYVDRVSEYYKLLSAHDCVAPKDQLVFF